MSSASSPNPVPRLDVHRRDRGFDRAGRLARHARLVPLVWAATGGLALSVLTGFVLSRTTGLPNSTGDIGNWSDGLGLASMPVEGAVVVLSAWALVVLPSRRDARPSRATQPTGAQHLPA
jgi:hypothetical protein